MYLFKSLNLLIQRYLPEDQIKLLQQAYLVARDAHEGQTRSSGESYITHPVAVACILAEMRLDHEALMAALLHDVIEDTSATYQDIEQLFGKSIAELVEGVSKLDKLKFRDKKEAQAENFRKMIMAMVQDIRVVLIKLADRTHNMRTLGALRTVKRRRIARETLEIYSPLAHRLGIHHLKTELEELGFEALYPNRYRVIKKVVKATCRNREEIIRKILAEIKNRLTEAGISCRVSGREKHLYSIYCKMHLKDQRFYSIVDIYAFQVIVSDLDTCYRVLGQMHSLYKPRPGRVKDYIAIPKANGYQSLHTSMIGPQGVPVEVQIRTEDMDQMAKMGVAAYWAYKEKEQGKIGTTTQIRAQRWMQSLLELQQSVGSSFEFIESVKSDFFPDEIYVFTPEGRIVELPVGATPVDFAYAVHTDIGHACVGARVNKQSCPLSQSLTSGQTVEIITASNSQPSADWLNFVVSAKAQAKIRHMLKNLKHNNSINLNRYLLNYAVSSSYRTQRTKANKRYQIRPISMQFFSNGYARGAAKTDFFQQIFKRSQFYYAQLTLNIFRRYILPIKGANDGMLVTFAKCCRPIPEDPIIIANIRYNKWLVIQYEFYCNIQSYQKNLGKFMPIEWRIVSKQDFFAKINQDALANLTTYTNIANFNIHSFNTEEKDSQAYSVFIYLTNYDRIYLADIMHKISIISDVIRI